MQGESKGLVYLVRVDRSRQNKNNGKCRIFLKLKLNKLFTSKIVQFQQMTERAELSSMLVQQLRTYTQSHIHQLSPTSAE